MTGPLSNKKGRVMKVEKLLYDWFVKRHGKGFENQYLIYRCMGCKGLVTWNKISAGGCDCGTSRIVPTSPSIIEKIKLFLFPWSV